MTSFINTNSGIAFNPLDPDPKLVNIDDIARGLSHICRFAGQIDRFYSVAEHSVHVSRVVEAVGGSLDACRWGLLHDASEAYLGDIPTPIKRTDMFKAYREAEGRFQEVIAQVFGLSALQPELVTQVDRDIVPVEAGLFFTRRFKEFQEPFDWGPQIRTEMKNAGWSSEQAHREFRNQFAYLSRDWNNV